MCRFDAVDGYGVLALWTTNGDGLIASADDQEGTLLWRAERGSGVFLMKSWEQSRSPVGM